jgi:hypothetical protein
LRGVAQHEHEPKWEALLSMPRCQTPYYGAKP